MSVLTPPGFAPIADSLRTRVLSFYELSGEPLSGEAGSNTLETNSGYVFRRGQTLLELLARRRGRSSLEGVSLVDLGCGFGSLSVFFAAQGASVVGVDPNEQRFEVGRAVAEEHDLDIRFVKGRMEELEELSDESFEIAVQNNSLCYVVPRQGRDAALRETLRVLEPGGWLVTRNPNRLHPVDQFTKVPAIQFAPPDLTVRLANRLGHKRSRVRLNTPWAAERELKAAGFVDVSLGGFAARSRPDFLKVVARYQHLIARRPAKPQ